MAFQSGVAEVGSGPHLALTWLVAIVLVACIALFVGMLAMEVWRSVRFAHRVAAARKATALAAKVRCKRVVVLHYGHRAAQTHKQVHTQAHATRCRLPVCAAWPFLLSPFSSWMRPVSLS